jgi:ABC-type uncharacterized transport system permease subunit
MVDWVCVVYGVYDFTINGFVFWSNDSNDL